MSNKTKAKYEAYFYLSSKENVTFEPERLLIIYLYRIGLRYSNIMKRYQILSKISFLGMLVITIQIIFFENYFSVMINRFLLYLLIAFFIIFPIVEILKKRAKKDHENKNY